MKNFVPNDDSSYHKDLEDLLRQGAADHVVYATSDPFDYITAADHASTDRQLSGLGAAASAASVAPFDRRVRWEVLLLLALVVAGVTGNLLVCVAVSVERKLQNVTNYFLVSLAVADLCVSLVVMPCCIVQEFIGYWPFGLGLCNAWQVTDVAMCTSSIMHMCTVSMDRYAGIRMPFKTRNRSRSAVAFKIIAVWLVSGLIACPLVVLGVYRPADIMSTEGQCAIFNSYFLIYGSLAAFFGPLAVMLVTYSLTIRLLSRRARQVEMIARQGMRRSITRRKLSSSSQTSTTAAAAATRNYLRRIAAGTNWNDYNSSTDNNEGLEQSASVAGGPASVSGVDMRPSTGAISVVVTSTDSSYTPASAADTSGRTTSLTGAASAAAAAASGRSSSEVEHFTAGTRPRAATGLPTGSGGWSRQAIVPIVITTAATTSYISPPTSSCIRPDAVSSSAASTTSGGPELSVTGNSNTTTGATTTTRRFKQRRRQPSVERSAAQENVTAGRDTPLEKRGFLFVTKRNAESGVSRKSCCSTTPSDGRGVSLSVSLPSFIDPIGSSSVTSSEQHSDSVVNQTMQVPVKSNGRSRGGNGATESRLKKACRRRIRRELSHCLASSTKCTSVDNGPEAVSTVTADSGHSMSLSEMRAAISTPDIPTVVVQGMNSSTSRGGISQKLPSKPIWLLRRRRRYQNNFNNGNVASLTSINRWATMGDSSLGSAESASTDLELQVTSGDERIVIGRPVLTSVAAAGTPASAIPFSTLARLRARKAHHCSQSSVVAASSGAVSSVSCVEADTDSTATISDSSVSLRFRSLVRKHRTSFRAAADELLNRAMSVSSSGSLQQRCLDPNGASSQLKSVKTERKAVKVLGTMFLLFVASWASFFSMNLAMGLCPSCHFDQLLFKWFLWLGYASSILNPIIYTVFNRAFKRTFVHLLTCSARPCIRRHRTMSTASAGGVGGGHLIRRPGDDDSLAAVRSAGPASGRHQYRIATTTGEPSVTPGPCGRCSSIGNGLWSVGGTTSGSDDLMGARSHVSIGPSPSEAGGGPTIDSETAV